MYSRLQKSCIKQADYGITIDLLWTTLEEEHAEAGKIIGFIVVNQLWFSNRTLFTLFTSCRTSLPWIPRVHNNTNAQSKLIKLCSHRKTQRQASKDEVVLDAGASGKVNNRLYPIETPFCTWTKIRISRAQLCIPRGFLDALSIACSITEDMDL